MVRKSYKVRPNSWAGWLLAIYVVLVFTLGGGSRADIQSLIILRPLAVALGALGLWHLTREHIRPHLFLFIMAGSFFSLILLHLMPLPPLFWNALPGRHLVAEIDNTLGLMGVWRPLSLVPTATWNALFALVVPFTVLIISVQLDREQLFELLPIILVIGLVSGFLGLLQAIGPAQGPLYFYRITNSDMAVGLFANRNHQAVFLATLFPMLAVFASAGVRSTNQLRLRGWASLAAAGFLIPLILVTGSRAGLLATVIGLVSSIFLYRPPENLTPEKRKGVKSYARYIYVAIGAASFVAVTFLMARAEAIERLLSADATEDLRWATLGPIINAAWQYFPIGSGIGSFVEVYQVHEPASALVINYVNHAHNDWVEILLTTGLPGALLAGLALWGYFKGAWSVVGRERSAGRDAQFARLGAVILGMLALASLTDYPLRVPSLSCLFVVAAVWLSAGRKTGRS